MSKIILSPGFKLNYKEVNPTADKVIVLIHGLGVTYDSWELQYPILEQAGYRVIAPDMRGFGDSDSPGPMGMDALASDIIQLLDKLGIEKASFCGVSMGGTIALSLALDHPDRVENLILANTFSNLRPKSLNELLYFISRFIMLHTFGLPAQGRLVGNRLFTEPEQEPLRQEFQRQIEKANPKAYRAAVRSLARFNVKDRLQDLTSPALVVTSDFDDTVAPQTQVDMAMRIKNARQIFLEAGHAAPVETPDAFNAALVGFLTEKRIKD